MSGREPPWPLTIGFYASLAFVIVSVSWFTVKDPDRLQDEKLQFKKYTLNLVAEKGTKLQLDEAAKVALAPQNLRDYTEPKEPS